MTGAEAQQHDEQIRGMSRWLAHGNGFLSEELVSEMYIAVLDIDAGTDKALCLCVARRRAIDYLRSRARNYSYGNVIQHVSWEAIMNAGFQVDTDGTFYKPGRDFPYGQLASY